MNVFPVTKMKVTAGDGSFPIETSHWGVFYMDTQENPLGVPWLKNYKREHPRRRLFYRYKTNIFKRPFIEIYGESHNDYNHASKNCKMLHDRPIWNIFLPILENILITTLCYFISEREVHWCYCPLIIVKNATVSLEGSTTAVNITDNIYFLLHTCSFLRANNKKRRFSLVLPPFPVKGPRLYQVEAGKRKHSSNVPPTEDVVAYKTGHLVLRVLPFRYSWAFDKNLI